MIPELVRRSSFSKNSESPARPGDQQLMRRSSFTHSPGGTLQSSSHDHHDEHQPAPTDGCTGTAAVASSSAPRDVSSEADEITILMEKLIEQEEQNAQLKQRNGAIVAERDALSHAVQDIRKENTQLKAQLMNSGGRRSGTPTSPRRSGSSTGSGGSSVPRAGAALAGLKIDTSTATSAAATREQLEHRRQQLLADVIEVEHNLQTSRLQVHKASSHMQYHLHQQQQQERLAAFDSAMRRIKGYAMKLDSADSVAVYASAARRVSQDPTVFSHAVASMSGMLQGFSVDFDLLEHHVLLLGNGNQRAFLRHVRDMLMSYEMFRDDIVNVAAEECEDVVRAEELIVETVLLIQASVVAATSGSTTAIHAATSGIAVAGGTPQRGASPHSASKRRVPTIAKELLTYTEYAAHRKRRVLNLQRFGISPVVDGSSVNGAVQSSPRQQNGLLAYHGLSPASKIVASPPQNAYRRSASLNTRKSTTGAAARQQRTILGPHGAGTPRPGSTYPSGARQSPAHRGREGKDNQRKDSRRDPEYEEALEQYHNHHKDGTATRNSRKVQYVPPLDVGSKQHQHNDGSTIDEANEDDSRNGNHAGGGDAVEVPFEGAQLFQKEGRAQHRSSNGQPPSSSTSASTGEASRDSSQTSGQAKSQAGTKQAASTSSSGSSLTTTSWLTADEIAAIKAGAMGFAAPPAANQFNRTAGHGHAHQRQRPILGDDNGFGDYYAEHDDDAGWEELAAGRGGRHRRTHSDDMDDVYWEQDFDDDEDDNRSWSIGSQSPPLLKNVPKYSDPEAAPLPPAEGRLKKASSFTSTGINSRVPQKKKRIQFLSPTGSPRNSTSRQ